MASIDAPSGTLIAYATAPGRVASDGSGANGLYTAELLRAIREPGLRVEEVFKRVRAVVTTKSGGTQVPWESSSLVGDFVFMPRAVMAPQSAPTMATKIEREYGTLAIRSQLAGTAVWLGDEKVVETQADATLVVTNVAAGQYRLRATKEGYKDWEGQVYIAADKRTAVTITIESISSGGRAKETKQSPVTVMVAPRAPQSASISGQWLNQPRSGDTNAVAKLYLILRQNGDEIEGKYEAPVTNRSWDVKGSIIGNTVHVRILGAVPNAGFTLTLF